MDSYETNYYIIKQLPPRAREILSVVNYAETELVLQALGTLDSSRKDNFENNKKVGGSNVKFNTLRFRPQNQQQYHGTALNCIQGDRQGRLSKHSRDRDRSAQPITQSRKGINANWREREPINFVLADTSQPPPNINNLQNTQISQGTSKECKNISSNGIRALQRSECIEDVY